jgi:Na+-driven multidrug efflux pump
MANTLGMGPLGVYITIALADALLAITAVVVFRRGQWKLRKV